MFFLLLYLFKGKFIVYLTYIFAEFIVRFVDALEEILFESFREAIRREGWPISASEEFSSVRVGVVYVGITGDAAAHEPIILVSSAPTCV
jgi:hypothetical protein